MAAEDDREHESYYDNDEPGGKKRHKYVIFLLNLYRPFFIHEIVIFASWLHTVTKFSFRLKRKLAKLATKARLL